MNLVNSTATLSRSENTQQRLVCMIEVLLVKGHNFDKEIEIEREREGLGQ